MKYWNLFWRDPDIVSYSIHPDDIYMTPIVFSNNNRRMSRIMRRGKEFDTPLSRPMAASSAELIVRQYRQKYKERKDETYDPQRQAIISVPFKR